jgi:catechol 2,3-dioxygenase-like lactoylglutathione lyase family enzyme
MRRITSLALLLATCTAPLAAQQPPALKANRVIIRVADLKASIGFYRDRVGLPLQSTFDEFAVLGGGDGLIVMLQEVTRKSTGPDTGLSSLTEIAFESADVFDSYEKMKARGVVFLRAPFAATTDGSRVTYVANFRDPDGHILSIIGWVTR